MAEAIWSVLQEGLSLSQAARKHDIPYPTFVLYANRVHNMLGPSPLNGFGLGDLRPKGRGRPQRILLGQWPEEHVRGVIRAVVFREGFSTTSTTPPAPVSSPQNFPSDMALPKTEPTDSSPPPHPLAAESKAAQAAFEAQMKSLYNNPFASQLLAASSKMFSNFDVNPFLQTTFKQEVPDDNFADAEERDKIDRDATQSNTESDHAKNDHPIDLANNTYKSIDAIASKLVTSAELDSRAGEDDPQVPSASPANLIPNEIQSEINENVFNCSDEIRKTMKSINEMPLLSPCSQERKSV